MSVWPERPTAGDMPGHGNRSVEQEELYDRVQASFYGYNLYRPQDNARIGTTYSADEYLITPYDLPASSVWAVDLYCTYNSSTTADLKVQFGAIASATYSGFSYRYTNAAGTLLGGNTGAQGSVVGMEGAGPVNAADVRWFEIKGTLFLGATPGKLWLEWAQNTNDAVFGTTLRQGSRLQLTRMA